MAFLGTLNWRMASSFGLSMTKVLSHFHEAPPSSSATVGVKSKWSDRNMKFVDGDESTSLTMISEVNSLIILWFKGQKWVFGMY